MKADITMATINLNTMTRDEYVAFRAVWKSEYKALSAEIAALKLEIKNGMRSGAVVGNSQNTLRGQQHDATARLALLVEAKAKLKTLKDEVARAA